MTPQRKYTALTGNQHLDSFHAKNLNHCCWKTFGVFCVLWLREDWKRCIGQEWGKEELTKIYSLINYSHKTSV